MWRNLQKLTVLVALTAALAGCGFQLKGSRALGDSSLSGTQIRLIAADPSSDLAATLTRTLRLAGATVVDGSTAELVLRVGNEAFNRRNLSLTAQARAAEVELTLATRFALSRDQRVLVAETDASVIRQMLDDPGNVVGKNEELRLLRDEMRRDVAEQIVRRVNRSLDN